MKVKFRPLTKLDLADRVRWFNDPDVSQFLGSPIREGTNLSEQKKWFSKYKNDESRKLFVIEADRKPVGNIGLIEIDRKDKNAGLFIFIGEKDFWSQGIAKQAIQYILNYGFKKLWMHKIWLCVCALNERAIRLYEGVGFEVEGRHSDMYKIDGRYYNELFMSLINPDK